VFIGILHTIFFHRFFPAIRPGTRDVLDLTLPFVADVELETLIDQKTAALVRQLDTSSDMDARSTGVRGQLAVQFFEKRRRKAWFTKGEEEVCWEQWTIDVTLATPRTESGMPPPITFSGHEKYAKYLIQKEPKFERQWKRRF
jgi:autophagy-related protein 101